MDQDFYFRADGSQPDTSGREQAYFKSDGIQSSDLRYEQNILGFHS